MFPDLPDAEQFRVLMRRVASFFKVLPLDNAVELLQRGSLPRGALAITFDDGYADNQTIAAPILAELKLTATFFVATGFLNGGRMWNDTVVEALRRTHLQEIGLPELGVDSLPLRTILQRRQAIDRVLKEIKHLPMGQRLRRVEDVAVACGKILPNDLMMSTTQLQALHASGMAIGGHTVNHPILSSSSDEDAKQEIVLNKQQLESVLQSEVKLFAYPNGKPDVDFAHRHSCMVREAGYVAAVTTAPGAARHGADAMQLPRFTPWDRSTLRFSLRMLANARQAAQVASSTARGLG